MNTVNPVVVRIAAERIWWFKPENRRGLCTR